MKTVTIFLASSEELLNDRKAFEALLYQKSKLWKDEKGIFLEMKNWENSIDAFSKTRLQDEYNKMLQACDIFVMLVWTKLGKYTKEEFEAARKQFLQTSRPLIYTYFKRPDGTHAEGESLAAFRKKLNEMGHFETVYKNTDGLLLHFNSQLDQLYVSVPAPVSLQKQKEAINKEEIQEMITNNNVLEAFEKLNGQLEGKNLKLNALMEEYVNPPIGYSHPAFLNRLKVFVTTLK